ncbi:MAG TPA: acyl-CoA dehydrogenase family protein [Candidatus Deferrimicrobium sp.]|nr:acyl-CoA dehydrogenase family protein [Candidatus Deferrimicrobium sp.]
MDFIFTEEQKKLRQEVRDFVRDEIIPIVGEYDAKDEFPMDVAQQAFDKGFLNVRIPKKYGGRELGLLDEVLITEELAYGGAGIATSFNVNSLGFEPILLAGTEDQKKKYLGHLTKKLSFVAFACSETVVGSDVAGIQCKAWKEGDNYILDGSKFWITNAILADFFVVFAKTGEKRKELSAFIVDTALPGVKVASPVKKMGLRESPTCAISFKQVKVPKENLLGKEGEGFQIAMDTFNSSRPAIGAFGIGLARRALDLATDYAKKRTAFTVPLANFQLIQALIADMVIGIEAAKGLTYKAAWLIDNKTPDTTLSSCAKVYSSEIAMKSALDCLQIWGGRGYLRTNPVEKLVRDAKVLEIYEGTTQIQKLIIGSSALGGSYSN